MDKYLMNRLYNCNNQFQGEYKRVLCVCSAGLLRSPTAAVVLASEPFNFNTRAAGITPDYALIPVDDVLLTWAQEIVCMTEEQEESLLKTLAIKAMDNKKVVCLNIPDNFEYRNRDLVDLIKEKYTAHQIGEGPHVSV